MWKTRSGRLALTTFILMLLGIQPPPALAQPLVMGILPLRYRTAEQMVPLVRPLVPPPGPSPGVRPSWGISSQSGSASRVARAWRPFSVC